MPISETQVGELFRTCNRRLYGLARRRVGREDAEDVVQDAYLRLLQLERNGELAHARGYLFRVAANVSVDWIRKRRTRSAYLVDNVEFEDIRVGGSAHAAISADVITMHSVQLCLSKLPRCCREAFLLNRLYGLSYPEIAERLGVSLRTVNRNVTRAVDHLHAAFELE